jgi:hypothetical protein
VEWVVTLSTFITTRERKMEDINVLTIPKWVFIYLFLSIHQMVLINMCKKIYFIMWCTRWKSTNSLILSTYFKTYIRKHVNCLKPNFINIYVHIRVCKVQFYNATLNNIRTYLLCCSLLIQGAFKFWFSAHHYANLILASRS